MIYETRNNQMARHMFLTFWNEIVLQKGNQVKSLLGLDKASHELAAEIPVAVDKIANELVELKICKTLLEARITLYPPLWHHGLIKLQ